jgi:hypothetical protein
LFGELLFVHAGDSRGQLPADVVPLPRLDALIARGVSHKMLMVIAPVAYGKTTTVPSRLARTRRAATRSAHFGQLRVKLIRRDNLDRTRRENSSKHKQVIIARD